MLLSVVVPVYNVEKYIETCVDSIVSQSYNDLEVILVDDGSTDSSGEICEELATKDNRISVVHKENGGLGFARNTGMDHARGEFIIFVDSDDSIEPESIMRIMDFVKDNPDGEVYYYGHNAIEEDGQKEKQGTPPQKKHYVGKECLEDFFLNCLGLEPRTPGYDFTGNSACMAMYRRSFLEENGLRFFSERELLSEDIFFNLQVSEKNTNIYVVPEHMYNYVRRKTSLTKTYRQDRFDAAIVFYDKMVESLKEYGYDAAKDPRVSRALIIHYLVCIKSLIENENNLGRQFVFNELKRFCDNPVLYKVVSEYPMERMRKAQRILFTFYKRKNVRMIYFLTKLKMR